MKYSILSVTGFLAAFSLGSPERYWGTQQAEAGDAIVTNLMSNPVDVIKEPGGPNIWVSQSGGTAIFPGGPSADLKINGQVEVSYVGGNQGTFNYVVNPIAPGFDGCVQVTPDGCDSIMWCSQPGSSPVVTGCPAGTVLPITLTDPSNLYGTPYDH